MSNPKTIYIHANEAKENIAPPEGIDKRLNILEYRLVEPIYDCDEAWDTGELGRDEEFVRVSDQSKIDLARAKLVENMLALNPMRDEYQRGQYDAIRSDIEIIDRISKE